MRASRFSSSHQSPARERRAMADENSGSTIVKFNVGGTRYEVARSLLASHPDTMLARMASEQWHDDREAEIFIERDGQRFNYCLDYLRDGKVLLPINVVRNAVLEDMTYYGIDVPNPQATVKYGEHDAQLMFLAIEKMNRSIRELDEEITRLTEKRKLMRFAMLCCSRVTSHMFAGEPTPLSLSFYEAQEEHNYGNMVLALNAYDKWDSGGAVGRDMVDEAFRRVGIIVGSIDSDSSEDWVTITLRLIET